MKLGVFGGVFNPPHNAHFEIANKLVLENIVEKLVFMPVGDFYKKNDLIAAKHRIAMLDMYTNENIYVSYLEVNKDRQNYMFETLDEFKNNDLSLELYLIIGSDNLLDLVNWKRYMYIIENYNIVVISRNDLDDRKYINEIFPNYEHKFILISNPFKYDISSRKIREKVRNNEDVSLYILKDVYEYIKENKLYEESDEK